ncbi:MAG: protein adenylyltransferase SelO family protein [bacterium]
MSKSHHLHSITLEDHHYQLGHSMSEAIYDIVKTAKFPTDIIRYRNERAAQQIGLASLTDQEWQQHFAQFLPFEKNQHAPLALRYHGHQFRNYNPDIGDGRGVLLAQLRDQEGRLLDLGTKGSGQTPFSRAGDGRLTLKGGVREVLATEMLEALGVYTSKTLSLIETGEELQRHDEPSPARSAVMVRLSHSHIRFGSFQYLAYHNRTDDITRLIDYSIDNFFPHLEKLDGEMRVIGFYGEVITRSANLAASWIAAGFVHGVLNTDNMNITGESFDYGPWRFVPIVDPNFTAAYFDHQSLYAYGRQAEAVAWNLAQIGGTLVGLCSEDLLNAALQTFAPAYEKAMGRHFSRRFGVQGLGVDFVGRWMAWMQETGAPFEQVIFDWFGGEVSADRARNSPIKELYQKKSWQELEALLYTAEADRPERLTHPYFSRRKPRTMLIEEMEALWAPIAEQDDWAAFQLALCEINDMREAYAFPQLPVLE